MCGQCGAARIAGFDMSKWECPSPINYEYFTTGNDTTTGDFIPIIPWVDRPSYPTKQELIDEFKEYAKTIKGEDTMYLYQVWLIYGEDRNDVKIVCTKNCVIAKNEEDAKIKSEVHKSIDKDWDSDYVTIICQQIGEVNVKPKPKEVKQV